MNIKLTSFLEVGGFAGLSSVTTQADVKERFGAPEDVSLERKGSVVWKYGKLQLFFLNEKLVMLFVYRLPDGVKDSNKSPLIVEDDFGFSPTLGSMRCFLEQRNISFRIVPELTFHNQTCWETSTGVRLTFAGNQLNKIGQIFA